MDFIHMLIFFAIAAAVIFGAQIIFTKFFVGDFDNSFDNSNFNPRSSLNKTLNRKMVYYQRINPLPMRWLVFFSNVLLPSLTVITLWSAIAQSLEPGFILDASFFIYLLVAGSCLVSSMLIRCIDTSAFYISFLPGIAFLTYIIFPVSSFNGVSIMVLCVFVPAFSLNALYFIRRRELFTLTLRQMKSRLSDQNAS